MNPFRRTMARLAKRAFDAASGGVGDRDRRWGDWAASWAPARQALYARHQLSARSSYLASNSPTAASIVDTWTVNLIGDGPSIRSNHPNESMRYALEQSFSQWSEKVDVAGTTDLTGYLNSVVRNMITTGESFTHFFSTQRGELRLRLLNSEQVDPSRNRELENMDRIIAGVVMNADGVIIGYMVFPQPPDLIASPLWHPVFVPAEDIAHVYESKVPNQLRGTSWLAPVMTTILSVDTLQDSLLARAQTAALFGAFISDPSGTSGFGSGPYDPQQMSLEPGVMRVLPPDCSVTFPVMPDSGNAPALMNHMLRQIASGVGLPFEMMTGNLEGANYSTAKLSTESFKRRCTALRETLLVAKLLRPVWKRWVTLEILSGRLNAPGFESNPEPYFSVSFLFPAWASLDPLKDAEADILLIDAGIRSRHEVIAARGRDPAMVDAEIASDTFIPRNPPKGVSNVKSIAT